MTSPYAAVRNGRAQTAIPAAQSSFVDVAASSIFPCLLAGATLVQQTSTLLAAIGQIFLWVAILAAAELITAQQSGKTFLVLVAMLAGFRSVLVAAPGNPGLILGYEVANGLIFLLAGTMMLAFRREVLHRQLRIFLTASVPAMLLQVYGKPGWIQSLRTDEHTAASPTSHEQMLPSLFNSDMAGFSTTQSRPAGLLHANNFLSIVILYAFAVQFRRSCGRVLSRTDVVLIAVTVLSMAKIALLSFAVFSLYYLVRGPIDTRARIAKMWGLLLVFEAVFFVLFPGIFLYDLSPNNALLNYAIRVADLRAVLGGLSMVDVVQIRGFDGSQIAVTNFEAGRQSGYAAAAHFAPYLGVVVPVLAMIFLMRLRGLRGRSSDFTDLSVNGLLVLALAPLITSFAGNPFFAFALGGLALPWIVVRRTAQSVSLWPVRARDEVSAQSVDPHAGRALR